MSVEGEFLRKCRDKKGWTQEELSSRSGVAQCDISMMETGARAIGPKRALIFAEIFRQSHKRFYSLPSQSKKAAV